MSHSPWSVGVRRAHRSPWVGWKLTRSGEKGALIMSLAKKNWSQVEGPRAYGRAACDTKRANWKGFCVMLSRVVSSVVPRSCRLTFSNRNIRYTAASWGGRRLVAGCLRHGVSAEYPTLRLSSRRNWHRGSHSKGGTDLSSRVLSARDRSHNMRSRGWPPAREAVVVCLQFLGT